MTRLVLFLIFLVAVVMVMSVGSYQSVPVDNSSFTYETVKKQHEEKLETIAALEQARLDAIKKANAVEEEVVEGPLVVLDTPQLESGHGLYAKCIVCHGKAGEGKKSQNAPAIGGQFDWYIEKQILAMQTGERVNQVMQPYIRALSAQDIKDLSVYISKLPWAKK
ncbi:MAG: hypothetical protein CME71_01010 [Halobacteriovorax sp.]|nr:hypothetical protein [Halobacteriovorax sp.]